MLEQTYKIRGAMVHRRPVYIYFLNVPSFSSRYFNKIKGAQWLSGRVLNSRPKGSGFEPHRRHCVVVLEQDTFILA